MVEARGFGVNLIELADALQGKARLRVVLGRLAELAQDVRPSEARASPVGSDAEGIKRRPPG